MLIVKYYYHCINVSSDQNYNIAFTRTWRPDLIKKINILESAERRATKLMFKDKTIPYDVRLCI